LKPRKNIVRWNITPMILSYKNLTLGYERVLTSNKSISLNTGILLLPDIHDYQFGDFTTLSTKNRLGYSATIDFRYYLSKRNGMAIPNGIYIGPYFGFYHYGFDSKLLIKDGNDYNTEIDVLVNLNMLNLGFELGYQFVFWNRLTLDLILIGPSVSYYKTSAQILGNLSIDKESETYGYLEKQIFDKYPWIETFINSGTINSKTDRGVMGVGFRYVIQVGFHF